MEADALAQVQAGAHMLDVNAGIPLADEPALLAKSIELVQKLCPDTPISIDSSIHEALEAGDMTVTLRFALDTLSGDQALIAKDLEGRNAGCRTATHQGPQSICRHI